MIEDFEERHHEFDGCFNFRDIGGYPTEMVGALSGVVTFVPVARIG